MIRKDNGELRNLFTCDQLLCRGCGAIIWIAPTSPAIRVRFRHISSAYIDHLKSCFPLKRLIIAETRKIKVQPTCDGQTLFD